MPNVPVATVVRAGALGALVWGLAESGPLLVGGIVRMGRAGRIARYSVR